MKRWISGFVVLLLLLTLGACSSKTSTAGNKKKAEKPDKIVLDYAYYSPTSLVLKEFGWVEETFKKEGIEVEYVLSQGSNKALEFLNSNSVDFGSTAGAAALLAKAKEAPIESVYVLSKPEWTALVTTKDSSIKSIKDLKGKKVAATVGTDPYIFLLRALDKEGLSATDVQLVNLMHTDGAQALLSNQVDAWAGLDPHMARVQVESDGKLFYRNPDFNTYNVLNVRSEFAEKYPKQVESVIEVYEKARKWSIENPEELQKILEKYAQIKPQVAKLQLKRTDFSKPIPGNDQISAWLSAGDVLQKGKVIPENIKVSKLVQDLINPSFAKKVISE